jgi:uncharacterized protein (TIGR02246 family)
MKNVQSSIADANQNFMNAFRQADAVALAALYTEDARLLPPGSLMVSGRQAIQPFWQSVMDMGIKEAKLETVEAESQGDLAYEIGQFTLTGAQSGGEPIRLSGKYVVVWKNENGTWKLHVDIWNADSPA